jgi:hypothetical protein
MGKKKDYDRALQQMMSMFQQAQQPSQFETQYQSEWNNLGNFLNSRDYRNLPNGVSIDMLPLAEMQKMRKMVRGGDTGGQGARGANMGNILNAQKEFDDNQFAQDWGGAYENKIGELSGRRDAIGNMLMGSDQNRKQLGIQGSQAYLQGLSNRPKSMWSSLLPSLISGGAQIGAAFI